MSSFGNKIRGELILPDPKDHYSYFTRLIGQIVESNGEYPFIKTYEDETGKQVDKVNFFAYDIRFDEVKSAKNLPYVYLKSSKTADIKSDIRDQSQGYYFKGNETDTQYELYEMKAYEYELIMAIDSSKDYQFFPAEKDRISGFNPFQKQLENLLYKNQEGKTLLNTDFFIYFDEKDSQSQDDEQKQNLNKEQGIMEWIFRVTVKDYIWDKITLRRNESLKLKYE